MTIALRVATINTAKGSGSYTDRIDALIEGLAVLDLDVIALQEALLSHDGSLDTARALAGGLRMHCAYLPARRKKRLIEGRCVESWSGLAVLARRPVVDVATRRLPSVDADGDRVALYCGIAAEGRAVRVANVHLTHLPDASTVRASQLSATLGDPWLARPAAARFLCGDLNAGARSAELRRVRERRTGGWDMLDAYEAGGGPLTATIRAPRAMDALDLRIDHIWSLARARSGHPHFSGAKVELARPGANGALPSDHLAVVVTAQLTRTPGPA